MTYLDMPYDFAAEKATLAALLTDPEAISEVATWLLPDHFGLEQHAWVYEAIFACYHRREPPDRANVTSELQRRERFEAIGGLSFFYRLFSDAGRPVVAAVATYARNVEQSAAARRLIQTGGEITALGYERGRPFEERLRNAEERLFALAQSRRQGRDFTAMSTTVNDVFDWLSSDQDPGLSTGFPDLDEILGGGLMASDLVILAARPSVGKTAMALSILYHVCIEQNRSAQFFSLEMGRQQLAVRLAAMRCGVPAQRIRPGRMRADEQRIVIDALGAIARDSILVDDTPCEDVMTMRAKARRAAAEQPPALIVVDYLGLAEGEGENRNQQVAYITRNLKAMARELNAPVLALSQLSRAVEGRASKVPQLSDLRDSGSVEQDADVVIFLHREDYYDKTTDRRGEAEAHIAKQRNGPLGIVPLWFDAPVTRFRSRATYQEAPGYAYDDAA